MAGFLLAAIAVIVVLFAAGYVGGLFARQPSISFVVPDNYTGYLVTRWECPGGIALKGAALGGWQDLTVVFDASGTACVADSIPPTGFQVGGFHYGDGRNAPVIVGGTRGPDRASPAGEADYVFSPLASIGIGNGQILGDECSLQEFLTARFGVPPRGNAGECEPIYVLSNRSLPVTPGLPTGPE